jgi:hypothetical protein
MFADQSKTSATTVSAVPAEIGKGGERCRRSRFFGGQAVWRSRLASAGEIFCATRRRKVSIACTEFGDLSEVYGGSTPSCNASAMTAWLRIQLFSAMQIPTRVDGTRIVGRQCVEEFGLDDALHAVLTSKKAP